LFQKPAAATKVKKEEKAPSPAKKAKPATTAAAAAATGGADIKEIVFSFDTTGSMYPCLTQVKIPTHNKTYPPINGRNIMNHPLHPITDSC